MKKVRFAAAALAVSMLFAATGCSLITITDTKSPSATKAPTEAPTPYQTPAPKYEVSFDADEVFETEIERTAAERIDGFIKGAVALMNTMNKRLCGELDPYAYDSPVLAKNKLKNDEEVKIYEDIERCAEGFLDYRVDHHEYGKDMFLPVTNAVDALRIDRPELFLYCDMKGYTDAYGTSYTLSYYMPNEWLTHVTDDKEAVKEAVALYYKIVDRIIAKMPDGLDNYEKCCYFMLVITLCTEYDVEQTTLLEMYQAYNVLVKGSAVCQGYADALLELMRRAGIRCEVVTGTAPSEGRHAWNKVYSDGKVYYVDVTWYDTDRDIGDFEDGKIDYIFMTEEDLFVSGYVPD